MGMKVNLFDMILELKQVNPTEKRCCQLLCSDTALARGSRHFTACAAQNFMISHSSENQKQILQTGSQKTGCLESDMEAAVNSLLCETKDNESNKRVDSERKTV